MRIIVIERSTHEMLLRELGPEFLEAHGAILAPPLAYQCEEKFSLFVKAMEVHPARERLMDNPASKSARWKRNGKGKSYAAPTKEK